MKICPNCNASVIDTAKFCNKCRFNIKKYEDEQKNSVSYCTECGSEIQPDSTFCTECGAEVVSGDGVTLTLNGNTSAGGFDMSGIVGLSGNATEQLFEKEGFVVENDVLVGYNGRKRSITVHGVEEIYNGAFENNDIITFVEIQEGVKIIGKRAFANCSSLLEINIPKSCKKIYDDTFEGTKLDVIILPEVDNYLIKSLLNKEYQKYCSYDDIKGVTKNENGKIKVNIKALEKCCKEKQNAESEKTKVEIGKTMNFGSYYQSGSKNPIEWIILEKEGNKALLISKYALDCKQYNTTNANVTWESCTLRKWLNNEFLNTAFNGTEKEKIVETTVKNENNPQYGTNGGNDTKDKVFLLSIDEAYKYFKDNDARMCKPTAYAISTGAFVYEDSGKYNGNGWWWLRSPGSDQNDAACVNYDGGVRANGSSVGSASVGVRPALWINL